MSFQPALDFLADANESLKARALCQAIAACQREVAAEIMVNVLYEWQSGGPQTTLFGDIGGEADLWAYAAPLHELVAYTLAGLARLGIAAKGLVLRKKLIWALWLSLSDADRLKLDAKIAQFRRVINGPR